MSRFNSANLKKTYYYLKRNGLRDTYLAALERLQAKQIVEPDAPLTQEDILAQRKKAWDYQPKFSILVPTYKTKELYLRQMVDSVLSQSYVNLELIIADASGDDTVTSVIEKYEDERIVLVTLPENLGISGNTNVALAKASGDYIGLLDHDDVLTCDALYEMASRIDEAHNKGKKLHMIYSDEDKCDENMEYFYETHRKKEFNLDLILSNNYICHFLVLSREIMEGVSFRKEYDGAQDFDLVLQVVAKLLKLTKEEKIAGEAENYIAHISRVLYHWRCHQDSTAVNPRSKMYAYESGQRAVQNFLSEMEWPGKVSALKHLGFYRTDYEMESWLSREDIGAVGTALYNKGKIIGGIYSADGTCPYAGLKRGFSGYMNRAALQQNAYAVDLRKIKIRPELYPLYLEIVGVPYGSPLALGEQEYVVLSLKLCEAIREKGYRVLWDPKGLPR